MLRIHSVTLFLTFCAFCAQAQVPGAPQNARGYRLPAEVLLKWDAAEGASHYKVYSGGSDRRWKPIADNVTATSYRDSDFDFLPGYYQIAAVSATGEVVAAPEFIVTDRPTDARFRGISVRMESPDSISFRWALSVEGDAQVEVGTGPNSFELASVSSSTVGIEHELLVTALAPAAAYWYRITSLTPAGGGISYVNQLNATYVPIQPATLMVPAETDMVMDEDGAIPFTLVHELPLVNPVFTVLPMSGGRITGASPNFEFRPPIDLTAVIHVLSYMVTDGDFNDSGLLFVAVREINDPPVAYDMSVPAAEDFPMVRILLEASDVDTNPDLLRYTIVNTPTNGTLVPGYLPNELFYTPRTNFHGIDHFTFKANDGMADGNLALARIVIIPQNDAPAAPNITRETIEVETVSIDLPAKDIDGDSLQYVITQPSNGIASLRQSPGAGFPALIRYTARAGFVGTDVFYYSVTDGTVGSSGSITIHVKARNLPPIAFSQNIATEYLVPITIQLTGSDPEAQSLSYVIAGLPANGSLSGTPPAITYTPNAGFSGTDTFTFTVRDTALSTSGPATVSIQVAAANAPPFAPGNLTATALERRRIQLDWQDHSGREQSFAIERSDDNRSFRQISTVSRNVLTFTDAGLNPGKTYFYRVRAVNENGASQPSNVASAMPMK